MKSLENAVLLTEIKYKPNQKPFFTIHGLGSFYAEHPFIFNSRILSSRQQAQELLSHLQEQKPLQDVGAKISLFNPPSGKKPVFNVVQVKGPIELHDFLPDEFSIPHCTEQLREVANPFSWVRITDKNLADNLLTKKLFDEKKISLSEAEKNFKECYFSYNENQKRLDVIAKQIPFELIRPMNYDEWLKQKWMFMDIEVPHYDRPNPRISLFGLRYQKEQEAKRKIFSLHPTGTTYQDGFSVVDSFPSEHALINAVAKDIQNEDSVVMTSFNTAYDFKKPTELSVKFDIGADSSEPAFDVSIPNRQRVKVAGDAVIDFYAWSKWMFDYLPRQKLEVITNHLLDAKGLPHVKKGLSYEQLTTNEDRAIAGDPSGVRENMSYLAKDVDWLHDVLFKSEEFQDSLRLATELGKTFHVPVPSLLWSPEAVNVAQQRSYFKHVGIHRSEVFRMTTQAKEKGKLARDEFKKALEDVIEWEAFDFVDGSNIENPVRTYDYGSHDSVIEARLTPGYALRHLVAERFPESKQLYDLKPTGEHFKKHERIFLSKVADAFARYITEDFGRMYGLWRAEINTAQEQGISIEADPRKIAMLTPELGVLDSKFGGNYGISFASALSALKGMSHAAVSFARKNNLHIIHQDGLNLYFTGGNKDVFARAPVIFTNAIDSARIVKKYGKQRLLFEQYGYTKGEKKPNNQLDLF